MDVRRGPGRLRNVDGNRGGVPGQPRVAEGPHKDLLATGRAGDRAARAHLAVAAGVHPTVHHDVALLVRAHAPARRWGPAACGLSVCRGRGVPGAWRVGSGGWLACASARPVSGVVVAGPVIVAVVAVMLSTRLNALPSTGRWCV